MSLLAVDHATPSNVDCAGYACTDQIQYSGFQAARHNILFSLLCAVFVLFSIATIMFFVKLRKIRAISCEHENKPLGSTKSGKSVDKLREY
jgi:hypothetical protein